MTLKQQRGMTMWSTAFVIGVVVFFLFLFFKLLPPYLEDLKVSTAINGLASEANAGTMSKTELVHRLEKRFDIDNVTNVKPNQLTIEARGKVKYMRLSYEVVVPMMYNVSALLEFDHAHEVTVTE